MGFGSFCFCLPSSSPKRPSNLSMTQNNSCFLTAPKAHIMDRTNSSKSSIEITKNKLQIPPQETQHLQEQEKKEFTTFKEWLLASPPTNGFYASNNGDEISQQRNFVKQNKVHPSLVEDCPDYGHNNSRGSFSKKRLLTGGEVDGYSDKDYRVSSFRKSRSKKIKKRVSFRLPEEADIYIYNLTEEE